MLRKFMLTLMVICLISPVFAQDKVIDEENWEDPNPSIQTKIIKQEKARAVLYTVYMLNDKGKIDHRIKLSDVQFVRFRARYTVVYNTRVRFHFVWTGPEFYQHTTDWYPGKLQKARTFTIVSVSSSAIVPVSGNTLDWVNRNALFQ